MGKRIAVVESNFEDAQDFVFAMRDATDRLYDAIRAIENAEVAFCDPKLAISLSRNARLVSGLADAVATRVDAYDGGSR